MVKNPSKDESAKPRRKSAITSDDSARKIERIISSIPDQDELFRFEISNENKVRFARPLEEKNDYATINALRGELLAENGPLEVLVNWLETSPNIPQAGLFGPIAKDYLRELSKSPYDINFAILYARGAKFYSARMQAERQVSSHEWPALDASFRLAIDAVCDLHGPLIMSSSVGSKIVARGRDYEATPEVYRHDQMVIKRLGELIAAETDLVEEQTGKSVLELTMPIENDLQPARSRGVGMMLSASSIAFFVGAIAYMATLPPPVAAIGAVFLLGTFEKTKRYGDLTDYLASLENSVLETAQDNADLKITYLKQQFVRQLANFVKRNSDIWREIADLRPEFGWAKKYLPANKTLGQSKPQSKDQSHVFIPFSSPVKALNAYRATFSLPAQFEKERWISEIANRRVMSDLNKLNLLERPAPGIFRLTKRDIADPEGMFKYAVSQQESIKLTRQILIDNPDPAPSSVCDLITQKLGKKYVAAASKVREGQALIRWARWVEPHLIDQTRRGAAILNAVAKATTGVRGRPLLATAANLNIVSEMTLANKRRSEIAKRIGVTSEAISSWVSKGLVPGVQPNTRGRSKKTEDRLAFASSLLVNGHSFEEVSIKVGVKVPTLKKWAREGKMAEVPALQATRR